MDDILDVIAVSSKRQNVHRSASQPFTETEEDVDKQYDSNVQKAKELDHLFN